MPQSPTTTDSPDSVRRAGRRHLRLTRRTGNAEALALAARIEAPLSVLREKLAAREAAEEAASDRFDDWEQDDRKLDAVVYAVERKCEDWDADHPIAKTHALVFAGSTAAVVARTRREDEPGETDKLVTRMARLPEGHPARPLAAQLTELGNASRTSQREHERALGVIGTTGAELEQAKLAVIAQYRDNAIDIVRAVGEDLAEQCFPRLRTAKKKPAKGTPGEGGT